MNKIKLGQVAGLAISLEPTGIIATLALIAILTTIGLALLGFSPLEAVAFGLISTLLHWLGESLHQLGHAQAARQTGYPMTGVRYGTLGLLSAALYPRDEPPLPGALHIHRALGGPKWSAVMALIAALLTAVLWNTTPLLRAIALLFFVEALFVFTLGALLPLGFTDGSTILKWRGKA
ncbi:MAG: hypothetical protein WCF84_15415 [Anaerolineae bacterium]